MEIQSLVSILFPKRPRYFTGQRWLNILLRSLHLVGIAGVAGGFLFGLDEARWLVFWQLTLFSGLGLVSLYLWSTGWWLVQLKGLAIQLKLLMLWLALLMPAWRAEVFVVVILLSAVFAHAPGPVKGYVPFIGNRGRHSR